MKAWPQSFLRVDGAMCFAPSTLPLSDRAFRLHITALIWQAGQNRGNTYVPDAVVVMLCRPIRGRRQAIIQELLDGEVWLPAAGGYWVDDENATVVPFGGRRPLIDPVMRQSIYERDGFCCLFCGATGDLSLDHVVPFSLGGEDSYANLRTLCVSCNSARGAGRRTDEELRSR